MVNVVKVIADVVVAGLGKKEKSRMKGSKRNFAIGGYNKYPEGGKVIEVEGKEVVINNSVNEAASIGIPPLS